MNINPSSPSEFARATNQLLLAMLWLEALHCEGQQLSPLRSDGLLACVGEYLAACRADAQA